MDNYLVINKFLELKNISIDDPSILGIVFYGSRRNNSNNDNSDIDLMIISNKNGNYKCMTYVDGIRIEYFIKNYSDLLEKVDDINYSLDSSLLSIFSSSDIIYSRDGCVELLKEKILSKKMFNKKNKNYNCNTLNQFICYYGINTDNRMKRFLYHNIIEQVRFIYHNSNGYSKLPLMKTSELYQNRTYAEDIYCLRLPDDDFINKYLRMINSDVNDEKMKDFIKCIVLKESKFMFERTLSFSELKCRGTIINNALLKLNDYCNDSNSDYIHYYYIVLEKIRSFYCDMNSMVKSICEYGIDYNKEFCDLFMKCLSDLKMESIYELFYYVSNPLDIDYKDYKVFMRV